MPKSSNAIVELIAGNRVSQERKISNEMLQNYSETRLKIELDKYKKETLSIMSLQLMTKVTETETPSPIVHSVEYSGYFINEEQFNEIKELLGWKETYETNTENQPNQD